MGISEYNKYSLRKGIRIKMVWDTYVNETWNIFENWQKSYNPFWNHIKNASKYFGIINNLNDPRTNWSTNYNVIYEHQTLKLLHFPSSRIDPNKRPILVLPPQAGHHSNLADYSSTQSLVKVFHSYGYDVYVCHWLSATLEFKDLGIEDYIRLTDEAVDEIRERTGFYRIHIMGQCQGGWQSALYTSMHQEKIATLALAAAPIDVNAAPSEIVANAQEFPFEFFEMLVSMGNGCMNGQYMLMGFKNMQAEEHYVRKYYRLWDMVQNNDKDGLRRFVNFENWYEYTQYLPGRFYLEVIKNIFRENNLTKPGSFSLDGRPVDLRNITCPVIILAGAKDHITPPEQAFALKKYISTPEEDVVEILTNGGHIGTLMGTEALREDWTAVAEVLNLAV